MYEEEECSKPDSDFPPKKLCGWGPDDRISELPDEIIITILSFLSVREAAATSLLSPRWSDLWKHTPLLKFEADNSNSSVEGSSWDVERCKYIPLVNTVLQLHKAPSLKTFRISCYVNKSATSAVAKWLEFVFSRQVESLELEFRCYQAFYKVVLEELLRESSICPQSTDALIMFKSLKSLTLKCLKLSGEDIKLFLRKCPLLEQMVINSATFTSNVEVCGANDLMLKRLDVRWCNGGKSIKVSAPNLTCMAYHEKSGKLTFGNVPKLEGMAFRILRSPEYVAQQFASAVSCIISQLQKLTLTLYHPKEFLANGFPKMPKLNKLVVYTEYKVYEQGGLLSITALIWASPRLQHFVLNLFGDPKDATSHVEVIENVIRHRHRHLKMFVFRGSCRGVRDHIVELMTYISANCIALREIIIEVTSEIRDELQARDYLKQQLQGKLHHRIQLQFLKPT